MADNLVINEITYPEVEAIAATKENGEKIIYYADAVRYKEQDLTETQKEQARNNIEAASQEEVKGLSKEIADKLPKNQGAENVGKILVVGTDGNLTLTEMPEGQVGDVVGTVDEDNNILLNGDIADGTYKLKYEYDDGDIREVGSIVISSIVTYSITKALSNCTASGATTINKGSTATVTLTANSGYQLPDSITVSGASYTWNKSSGQIVLSNPTGDVAITVTAEATGPANLIPLSTNADGTPYEGGKGYKTGYKISVSGGGESASSGIECTGFMPIKYDDTIYFKDITFDTSGTTSNYCFYDSSKNRLGGGQFNNYVSSGDTGYGPIDSVVVKNMTINQAAGDIKDVAFIRISAREITDNSIMTTNQPIV